ncbi:MAG: ABC transporter substrate-binding protein [Hyphomicrobiaceae bacterium]|nr:ABC transporter substrate-binding protein [Hyphomicrobiaceae bacterium]
MPKKCKDFESQTTHDVERELYDAYDFDPQDPMFGLSSRELSGPQLERRTVLRLMAAAGTLSAMHLIPGSNVISEAAAASGGTLKCGWAGVGEFRTFDPARIAQVLLFQISSNVLSGLTHINPKLVAEGDLALDWTVNDAGTEYVFNLREGVTFHNGDKFTADDVVYTYNRSKDPKKSIHGRVIKNVTGVERLGDHKVKITLKAPQASFLTKALERSSGRAMTIVSRGAIEKMGDAQYGLTPVGTGPFRITDHKQGQSVTLERFDKYYDPDRPKLDKIIITPIVDAEPLAAAMEAGDISLIGGNPVAPELVGRFEKNPDINVSIVPGPGFQSVWMNPHIDPFKVSDFNKPLPELMKEKGFKVRLAIAKALDRDQYIKQAQFGRGVPAYGTINPAMGFYFDERIAENSNQQFDLKEAQRLLAEAGYPGGKGFPELTMNHTPSARREVQVIKAILKRNLGINIKLAAMDFPVVADKFQKLDWELTRLGSGGDFDPDDGIVDWMQTSSKFNGRTRDKSKYKFGYWSDAETDKLIDEQGQTADLKKRKELVQKANKITSDKVASAFLFHPMDVLVYSKKVNFPAESRIPGLVDLDRVTIS